MVQFAENLNYLSARADSDIRILWVGSVLPELNDELEDSYIDYALDQVDDLAEIPADMADDSDYDCVIVNFQKDDHSQYLRFAMIMANRSLQRILVLAPPEKVEFLAAMPGVACVFEKPVSASHIVEELEDTFAKVDDDDCSDILQIDDLDDHLSVSRSHNLDADNASVDPTPKDEQGDSEETKSCEPVEKETVTGGFETSVSLAREIDQSIWRRFLPMANFLYKKMAILALGSLFLTFLAYGAMIVFYLSNSSWTLPFELSAGHKIVQKLERDLSQLRVSQNMFRQQLTVNTTELSNAARKERQGQLQIDAIAKTLHEEIYSKQREQRVLKKQIKRLKDVESQIVTAKEEVNLAEYFTSMQKLLKEGIVPRRVVEGVRLTLIEAEHRLAMMSNEIVEKREHLALSMRQERQLRAMLEKVDYAEFTFAPTMDAQFSHMVADLMAARTAAQAAKSEHSAAKERQSQLQDSLQVVTGNIENIIQTPAARAINKPVAVMFVPYQNSEAAMPKKELYGCRFFIFICKKVGKLGRRVDGETVAAHPLFERPMRGYFVEAKFDDPESVTEEILHIGGAPALF